MEQESSYFERLTFDPSLKKTFIARYYASIRAVILIIFTLTAAGLVTFFTLPRELNPSIEIPIVFVSTAFPGAGPEDIEALITIPLEDALESISDVQSITSSSQENVSSISIEFLSGTDPQRAKEEVQSAIDTVTDLPEDSRTPAVQVLDFQDQPVLTFLLASEADPVSLYRFADALEDALKNISGIEKVVLSYRQDPTVDIVLKPETLREKKLDALTVSRALEAAMNNYPAGNMSTDTTVFALTQHTFATTVEELRRVPLNINSTVIALGEIAEIRERQATNSPTAYYADIDTPGTQAVVVSAYKTDAADAGDTVAAIRSTFSKLNEEYGARFVLEPLFDSAREIEKSFDQLFFDFMLTITLVFAVLFVFFGMRQSVIASLAIPLTFLGTFLVMNAVGITINFIALFSLLLALGILVDNAIVIISAMAGYERTRKFTPDETALLVWRDFRTVIFTTTLTTVWAFIPLLLATGIIGEFIKPIPIVVSSALSISAVIALFIVTPMMALLLKGEFPRRVILAITGALFLAGVLLLFVILPNGPAKIPLFFASLVVLALMLVVIRSFRKRWYEYEASHFTKFFRKLHSLSRTGLFNFEPLAHRYERLIRRILDSRSARRKTLLALIIFSIFSYALVPLGYVVNEFFPQDDQDTVYIAVELPQGTSLAQGRSEAQALLDQFRTYPEARFVLAEIGAVPPTDVVQARGEFNNLLFTFNLIPSEERERRSGEIIAEMNRRYGNYAHGKLSASQISGGPPAGSDLQLKLLGDDLVTLQEYGRQVSDHLRLKPGITNVSTSIESGASKIVFIPNQDRFALENISDSDSALLLRTLGSGLIIKDDARLEQEKRDVVIRFNEQPTLDHPEKLGTLSIEAGGRSLPLLALGNFILEPNPTLITREDGKRTLSVSAGVLDGYSVSTQNAELEAFADELDLPEGYSWKTGGVNEENAKSVRSILLAMLLSAALIFGTMTIQFNSFRKAIIVLLVIPLAVSGVFILFALTGTPLSFPALIGVLALFGIVVNNSIIMVDKINRNMDAGLPLDQAIAEGAASRLEPILLTALTTIVGLIPITLSDPIWQGLGGAIIAGLTFSGVAKLFFIPVIYHAWFTSRSAK